MSNRKNFSINVNQDDNDVVDISISHDFNIDSEYDDLVKKLTSVF